MATVTRYVNPASTGGDGTTNGLSGATAAYASLSAWNTAEATDLVTDTDIHEVYCEGSTNDSGGFTMSGWTTGAANYIRIIGDHSGATWDDAAYIFEITGAGSGVTCSEDYVRWENVQFDDAHTTGARWPINFTAYSATCDIRVQKCIFWGTNATSSGAAIRLTTASHSTVRIENCLFYDFDNTSSAAITSTASAQATYIEHCTIINCLVGVLITSATRLINVGYDSQGLASADGFDTSAQTGSASSLNCFSDLSTDATSLSGSGHGDSTTTPTFTNEGSDDFSLASGDASWKDAGGTAVLVTDDIVGTTRTGTFDVGFFEVVAAANVGVTVSVAGDIQ